MWHPGDEAEATSNRTALIEWLRATGILPDAHPEILADWRAASPVEFQVAITAFLRLSDPVAMLTRAQGPREALVLYGPHRQSWTRDDLRAALPPVLASASHVNAEELAGIAVCHLLDLETRPDQRLLWAGPSSPAAFGALLFGATLILVDAPVPDYPGIAATEGARLVRPPGRGPAPR